MLYLNNFYETLAKKEELYLKIKVSPGSKENAFSGLLADGILKISLRAPAEDGKANLELFKFLAKEFKVSRSDIKIISGKTGRIKLIKIKKS